MDETRGGAQSGSAAPSLAVALALVCAAGFVLLLAAAKADWLSEPAWLRTYAIFVLVPLICAALALRDIVRASGSGGAAGVAWRLLFTGVTLWFLGQASLAVMRFRDPAAGTDFPSIADVFFITGQALMIAGLILHFIAYLRTGLPVGGAASYVIMYLIVAVIVAWLTIKLAVPVWSDPSRTFGWKAVSTVYHVFDMLTLCAALALARIALVMRGGSLAAGWAGIAAGFVVMMIADMLFAIDIDHRIGALVFLIAHSCVAYGAVRHREVIRKVG